MGETMYPIAFHSVRHVSHLADVLDFMGKVPEEHISLLATVVTQGKSSLMLLGEDTSTKISATAIVMPGHDNGWLLVYLYLPEGAPVSGKGQLLLDPKNHAYAITGDPIKKDLLEFTQEVTEALSRWRALSPTKKTFAFDLVRIAEPHDTTVRVIEAASRQEAEAQIEEGWKIVFCKES